MSYQPIEQSELYCDAKSLANQAWLLVKEWDGFAKWTVGRQLVSSLDSVAANLAEGDGRYSDKDSTHFFVIARGSVREAGYWIEVASERGLLNPKVAETYLKSVASIGRQLNGLITYRRNSTKRSLVKEETSDYLRPSELNARSSTLNDLITEELQFNEG